MTIILFCSVCLNPAYSREKGSPAPHFSLPQIGTEARIDLNDFRGKVVYIDFWASWCVPCRASFPLLNQLYLAKKDQGFEIIAINLDEDDDSLNNFVKLYPVDFILVRDKAMSMPDKYQVKGMPSSFFVDKKGQIRFAHKGFKKSDMRKIEAELNQLLQEPD